MAHSTPSSVREGNMSAMIFPLTRDLVRSVPGGYGMPRGTGGPVEPRWGADRRRKAPAGFPREMNFLRDQCGASFEKICEVSHVIKAEYKKVGVTLDYLTLGTLNRMLHGKIEKYTRTRVLAFYLSCRRLEWEQRGKPIGAEPKLADAEIFFEMCLTAHYDQRTGAPPAADAVELIEDAAGHGEARGTYNQFDLDQRRVYDSLGARGLILREAAAAGDRRAAVHLGVMYLLTNRNSEARTWLKRADAFKDGQASRLLADMGSGDSRKAAACAATKIGRYYRQTDVELAIRYFELASQNDGMDAAYCLGEISEEREQYGEAIRSFAEAERLGHPDARRRIDLITDQLAN